MPVIGTVYDGRINEQSSFLAMILVSYEPHLEHNLLSRPYAEQLASFIVDQPPQEWPRGSMPLVSM